MNKVRQLLSVKGGQVYTISKDSTVMDGLVLMAEKQIGALLVMEGEKLIGIFTERDLARRVSLPGKRPEQTHIKEVMTRDLLTIDADQSVNECMTLMTEKRIRHLPVMDAGRLVGLISIGDVVRDVVEELEHLVKQLQDYITGSR